MRSPNVRQDPYETQIQFFFKLVKIRNIFAYIKCTQIGSKHETTFHFLSSIVEWSHIFCKITLCGFFLIEAMSSSRCSSK